MYGAGRDVRLGPNRAPREPYMKKSVERSLGAVSAATGQHCLALILYTDDFPRN